MGMTPERMQELEEERREKRADNSGGHVSPYLDTDDPSYLVGTIQPVEEQQKPQESRSRSPRKPPNTRTVPSGDSKVLRILGVGVDDGSDEVILEPNEALERIRDLKEERARYEIGDKAVRTSIKDHPSRGSLPSGHRNRDVEQVNPRDLASELGVPVAVKKDPFGNRVITPLFPEPKYKKSK